VKDDQFAGSEPDRELEEAYKVNIGVMDDQLAGSDPDRELL